MQPKTNKELQEIYDYMNEMGCSEMTVSYYDGDNGLTTEERYKILPVFHSKRKRKDKCRIAAKKRAERIEEEKSIERVKCFPCSE